MRSIMTSILASSLVCTLLVLPSRADDPPFKFEVVKQAAPQELAKPLRAVLEPSAIRLLEDGKVFYEFWFRKEIPMKERPESAAAALNGVAEGTLLGAIKVHEERYDFKDEEIPPGVYALRLGLQPQDGDHLGTAPTRTFVLLIPAKEDQTVDAFSDHDALSDASSAINAAEHPSNLNLQPATQAGKQYPRIVSDSNNDWYLIYLQLNGKLKDQKIPLTFALVFEGVGEY